MKFFLKIMCLFFIVYNNASSRQAHDDSSSGRARHDRFIRQEIQDGLDDYFYYDELINEDSNYSEDSQTDISTMEIPLMDNRVIIPHIFFEKFNVIRNCYYFYCGHKKRTE